MEDVKGAGGGVLVHGRDLMMGEELELGRPPPRDQLEEAGW